MFDKGVAPAEFVKTCTLPPGVELKPFADEKAFPELAKPVQLEQLRQTLLRWWKRKVEVPVG